MRKYKKEEWLNSFPWRKAVMSGHWNQIKPELLENSEQWELLAALEEILPKRTFGDGLTETVDFVTPSEAQNWTSQQVALLRIKLEQILRPIERQNRLGNMISAATTYLQEEEKIDPNIHAGAYYSQRRNKWILLSFKRYAAVKKLSDAATDPDRPVEELLIDITTKPWLDYYSLEEFLVNAADPLTKLGFAALARRQATKAAKRLSKLIKLHPESHDELIELVLEVESASHALTTLSWKVSAEQDAIKNRRAAEQRLKNFSKKLEKRDYKIERLVELIISHGKQPERLLNFYFNENERAKNLRLWALEDDEPRQKGDRLYYRDGKPLRRQWFQGILDDWKGDGTLAAIKGKADTHINQRLS